MQALGCLTTEVGPELPGNGGRPGLPGDKGRPGVARRRRNALGGLATDVGLGLLDNGGRPGVAWQRRWSAGCLGDGVYCMDGTSSQGCQGRAKTVGEMNIEGIDIGVQVSSWVVRCWVEIIRKGRFCVTKTRSCGQTEGPAGRALCSSPEDWRT